MKTCSNSSCIQYNRPIANKNIRFCPLCGKTMQALNQRSWWSPLRLALGTILAILLLLAGGIGSWITFRLLTSQTKIAEVTLAPSPTSIPLPTETAAPYLSSSAGPTFTPVPTETPVPYLSSSAGPTFTPVPTKRPVQPTLVVPIQSITTSSTHPGTSVGGIFGLGGQKMTVEPGYAIDSSDDTGWVSNYTLKGSWVRLQLQEEKQIAALRILNGGDFLDDEAAFIKTATLSFSDGSTQIIHLEDNYSIIEISPVYTDWVEILVDEVHDNKPNARLITILDLKLYGPPT